MYAKTHKSEYGLLVAACDDDINGKKFKHEKETFYVNPEFYGKKKISEKNLINLFSRASSANLIGKQVVNLGIELGLVDQEHITRIKNIPHAIVVVMQI